MGDICRRRALVGPRIVRQLEEEDVALASHELHVIGHHLEVLPLFKHRGMRVIVNTLALPIAGMIREIPYQPCQE
jgi:hypothetical protein